MSCYDKSFRKQINTKNVFKIMWLRLDASVHYLYIATSHVVQ